MQSGIGVLMRSSQNATEGFGLLRPLMERFHGAGSNVGDYGASFGQRQCLFTATGNRH